MPPENANGDLTDIDSGEEDEVNLSNLPGSQLRAPAEIELVSHAVEDVDSDPEDILPLSHFIQQKHCKKRKTYLWSDEDISSLCSNSIGIAPLHSAKRYSYKEKKNISISQPHIVNAYNQNMGGVDRCDQNVSLYRTSVRGKKWYFPLIMQALDLAIHNAWQLHKTSTDKQNQLDHLSFRRQIALSILQSNLKDKGRNSTGKPNANENIGIRYDKVGHFVIPQDSQTRCRHCHTKTTTRCVKCDIGLHVKCFYVYHTL